MMFAAIAAIHATMSPGVSQRQALAGLGAYEGRGKGGGKHPRHPSARFVAQDKRDARKARNRK